MLKFDEKGYLIISEEIKTIFADCLIVKEPILGTFPVLYNIYIYKKEVVEDIKERYGKFSNMFKRIKLYCESNRIFRFLENRNIEKYIDIDDIIYNY